MQFCLVVFNSAYYASLSHHHTAKSSLLSVTRDNGRRTEVASLPLAAFLSDLNTPSGKTALWPLSSLHQVTQSRLDRACGARFGLEFCSMAGRSRPVADLQPLQQIFPEAAVQRRDRSLADSHLSASNGWVNVKIQRLACSNRGAAACESVGMPCWAAYLSCDTPKVEPEKDYQEPRFLSQR